MNTSHFFDERSVFYGDLHNHCGISYGHGPIEDAYRNAKLQLDFASVTGHGAWPDINDQSMPEAVVQYHREGFAELRRRWSEYLAATESARTPGKFETFFSYEIHSFRHGDKTAITPDPPAALTTPDNPEELAAYLARTDAGRDRVLLLPHHIGYQTGYRGVNWETLTDEASPIVEIISMHGLAEADDGNFPYLHTMGPLDGRNTMVGGLQRGRHFGVVGNTDHHSSHPGSFGYGKTAVWAPELTRQAIWEAFLNRRTYAVSGDRIRLAFAINGLPLGSQLPRQDRRMITAEVVAGGPIDRIEVIKNGRRRYRHDHPVELAVVPPQAPAIGKIVVEVGWGQKGEPVRWDVEATLEGGRLLSVEPRLHGHDVVDPLDTADGPYAFSNWDHDGNTVRMTTRTVGNPTATSPQTQAVCLEVHASPSATLQVRANGTERRFSVAELTESARTFYTAGFVSPAVRVHRFAHAASYTAALAFTDDEQPESGRDEDWYYVRVIQRNGHAAWSSPIWVANG